MDYSQRAYTVLFLHNDVLRVGGPIIPMLSLLDQHSQDPTSYPVVNRLDGGSMRGRGKWNVDRLPSVQKSFLASAIYPMSVLDNIYTGGV